MLEKSIRIFTSSAQTTFNLFNQKNLNILEAC